MLAWTGLVGWFCSAAITYQYFYTLPRAPDPKTGRIYPRNMHGIGIYQTKNEDRFVDILGGVSFAIGGLGLTIAALEEKHWKRTTGYNIPPMPRDWRPK